MNIATIFINAAMYKRVLQKMSINEYFFGFFYITSYSFIKSILSASLIPSNIVTHFLLHHVISYVLVLD